jgi:hypothetical protein
MSQRSARCRCFVHGVFPMSYKKSQKGMMGTIAREQARILLLAC